MKFKSKKGIVHGLLYWGSVLITAGIAYYSGALWVWIIPALLAFFFGWIWFGTYYVLEDKELVVKYGPASERIPYHLITRVAPCHNMKSSAALSLDRLEVKHGGGLMPTSYISPKDQQKCVEELKIRSPQAKFTKKAKGEKDKPHGTLNNKLGK